MRFPLLLSLLCATATATDVAFWKPYMPDDRTPALLHFDLQKPPMEPPAWSLQGDAALVDDGRFGGALRLAGNGFATLNLPPLRLDSDSRRRALSVEAWVKLDRYPGAEQPATLVARDHHPARNTGFAIEILTDGAIQARFTNPAGRPLQARTSPAALRPGEWAHIAAVVRTGLLTHGKLSIFVNGRELAAVDAVGSASLQDDADDAAAPLVIGAAPDGANGLAGVIDEVRLHTNIHAFWELEPTPWVDRIAAEGMLPTERVLPPESQPRLTFSFDDDTEPVAGAELAARDPAIVERYRVNFKGDFVPGVKGMAADGPILIDGFPLTDWRAGAIELWAKPKGWNNLSDSGVGFFSSAGFAMHIAHTGRVFKFAGITTHTADGRRQAYADSQRTLYHPGRWYHLVLSWNPGSISLYVDGSLAASGPNYKADQSDSPFDSLKLNQHGSAQRGVIVDELAIYPRGLSANEAANRYWSYVDPEKVRFGLSSAPLTLEAWSFPSSRLIRYQLSSAIELPPGATPFLELRNERGDLINRTQATWTHDPESFAELQTGALPDGIYQLLAVAEAGETRLLSEPWSFRLQEFPWKGNTLGLTDEVFPPFEPVRVADDTVSIVQRDYRMNGFGLWDSVRAQGRELLAAPIRLRHETMAGDEGAWTFSQGEWLESADHRARHLARASSPALDVETLSEIEMDGMMKVTMRWRPGVSPEAGIRRLWLEVPMRPDEASLMHEDTGSLRRNYAGSIPAGDGLVWQSRRKEPWRNAFAGYVWMGGVERGIAWFAANDRGWITEKELSDRPLQEIVRTDAAILLRVNLVNLPTILEGERELVFGLQASPVKPMPDDWRTVERPGGGLPVVPFGGLCCAYKFPFEDRWEIVDKIIEFQNAGQVDVDWFKTYRDTHRIPPLGGTGDWVRLQSVFAARSGRPQQTYFEEMAAPTDRPEWHVYKDEWSRDLLSPRRQWPTVEIFREGLAVNPAYRSSFGPSYRDYGAWYMNEWNKRGIGVYWDNTYLTPRTNPLTSGAYRTEDGNIQPSLALWEQRAYAQRAWNLMQHWSRIHGEPMRFVQHMTNTNLLPILAWATTSLDNEYSASRFGQAFPEHHDPREPYPPGYLRAVSLGRQCGNYATLVHPIFRAEEFHLDPADLPPTEIAGDLATSIYARKREWGMLAVHEIPRSPTDYRLPMAAFEKALRGFGYGTDQVAVHNYWADQPALAIDDESVKWLLLARPRDRSLLLVLQSWSRSPGRTRIRLHPEVIGFTPRQDIVDLQSGQLLDPMTDEYFEIALRTPYAIELLRLGNEPREEGVLFHEAFTDGPSLQWDFLSPGAIVHADPDDAGHLLRLGGDSRPRRGHGHTYRLEKWTGPEDARLYLRFRASTLPDDKAWSLFTILTRAATPAPGGHLVDGQMIEISLDPATGSYRLLRFAVDTDGKRTATARAEWPFTPGWQELSLTLDGDQTLLHIGGALLATFPDTPHSGTAFGLRTSRTLTGDLHLDIERLTMTSH